MAFSILSNNFNLPDKRVLDAMDNIVGEIVADGLTKNGLTKSNPAKNGSAKK